MIKKIENTRGFTLIELLVVISIIGLLASIIFVSLDSARGKGKEAARKATLRQLQSAVELYFSNNASYPSSNYPADAYSSEIGDNRPNGNNNDGNWIPGLTPTYISKLPKDPEGGASTNPSCISFAGFKSYLYLSDGVNYKIGARCSLQPSEYDPADPLYDPLRAGYGWMVCSGEPACSGW